MTFKNNELVPKNSKKGARGNQGVFDFEVEREEEIQGIGMGVFKDGTPFLSQRGLAALCGVQNAHIGTLDSDWDEEVQKRRVTTVKGLLAKRGTVPSQISIKAKHNGRNIHAYPASVCLAVLEYYAFEAGTNIREEAITNFRILAGEGLQSFIYSQLGYDPARSHDVPLQKWHDRIALNHKAAPKGFFHVFNEAHTIIYELIVAGAEVGEKFVVDISIGSHWSTHWQDKSLESQFGPREQYEHNYPDSHPQSKANPHKSWCYPLKSLGYYREWLQNDYLEGGKFSGYLKTKVSQRQLAPSMAMLALSTLAPGLADASATRRIEQDD